MKDSILLREEWVTGSSVLKAHKIGNVKFYQCPLSVITRRTWEILRVINTTTDIDGNIILPYRGSSYVDLPKWYTQALRIVISVRGESRRLEAGK